MASALGSYPMDMFPRRSDHKKWMELIVLRPECTPHPEAGFSNSKVYEKVYEIDSHGNGLTVSPYWALSLENPTLEP